MHDEEFANLREAIQLKRVTTLRITGATALYADRGRRPSQTRIISGVAPRLRRVFSLSFEGTESSFDREFYAKEETWRASSTVKTGVTPARKKCEMSPTAGTRLTIQTV